MVKFLVLAVLLASSPATGMIETLFGTTNSCHLGCKSNYMASVPHLQACHEGCKYKLYNGEDCAGKCKSNYPDEQIKASCQVGCTLGRSAEELKKEIPAVVPNVDPAVVPVMPPETVEGQEPQQFRSIILVRLRRPLGPVPALDRMFGDDPAMMFKNIFSQFREKAQEFDQMIRAQLERPQDMPKTGEFGPVFNLIKSIPIMQLPNNVRADSSSESSESSEKHEKDGKRPLFEEMKHVIKHPREQQERLHERVKSLDARIQQFFNNVRTEWQDLVRKQPKLPIWIFLCILLSSSAILWYMVMSLCRHTPSRDALSIRAQELVFHPYDHDGYEKEKIQPDDQLYEVTEPLPIKVKLSNI